MKFNRLELATISSLLILGLALFQEVIYYQIYVLKGTITLGQWYNSAYPLSFVILSLELLFTATSGYWAYKETRYLAKKKWGYSKVADVEENLLLVSIFVLPQITAVYLSSIFTEWTTPLIIVTGALAAWSLILFTENFEKKQELEEDLTEAERMRDGYKNIIENLDTGDSEEVRFEERPELYRWTDCFEMIGENR